MQEALWTHINDPEREREIKIQMRNLSLVKGDHRSSDVRSGQLYMDKEKGLLLRCRDRELPPLMVKVGSVQREGKKAVSALEFWKGLRMPSDSSVSTMYLQS